MLSGSGAGAPQAPRAAAPRQPGAGAPQERRRLGVLGWPVAQSRSPQIQNAALEAVGLGDWRYQLLPVPPPLLPATVRALGGAGFRGANVTIPHKQAAARLADRLSATAREIGAVNTLVFEPDDSIDADNTDAPALIAALPFAPSGRTALVLGAGGSAQAAVWALRSAGAAVFVWNRTPQRARELAERFGATPASDPHAADMLVNCTPAGMSSGQGDASRRDTDNLKPLPIKADEVSMFGCVVDFVYAQAETPLAGAARRNGLLVVDGWELLVRQAALSFERFTGVRAPLEVMYRAVTGP